MRILGLLTTLWTALLVFPSSLLALGLGEIETNSFLNQPLKAQIEVISARPGEIDDLLVTLASRDSFRKAGLDRPASLSKLKFTVEKSEDGQTALIHVTTKQAVTDPFLNFLLEADWGKGRLLREFTVLLDPPYFAQQDAADEQLDTTAAESTMEPSQPANVIDRTPEPAAVASPSEPEPSVSQPIALGTNGSGATQTGSATQQSPPVPTGISGDVVVRKGDTLWGIASQFQDGQHSMNQIMLAIQMMNPDAFGNDNINNLKVGSVIRAPDQSSLDSLSKQQAYAQVLEQNGLWDEYVARKSGSTVSGSPMAGSSGSSGQQKTGQLSLVTPNDGDSESASQQDDANSDNAGQIRKRLALAEEELEAARLENSDLISRISSLEQQLNKFQELEKLVQLEDDSLAQLQQQAEQADTTDSSSQPAMVTEQPTESMVEAAQEMMQQEEQASIPVTDDGMKPEEPVLAMESTEAETVIQTVPEPDTSGTPAMADEETPPPAPVIVTEAPTSAVDDISGMIPSLDGLLADPIMLGGIGGILVILLLWFLIKRRKSAEQDEGLTLEMPDAKADDDATPIHVPSEDAYQDTDIAGVGLDDTSVMDSTAAADEDEFASTAIIQAEDMPKAEEPAAEQDGILDEVDVYLAYGLYDNAEELLSDSIRDNPDRADYRAKLLDTYFATKNRDAFVKEADNLRSLGSAADRFWDRVQIMGHELAPENDMFTGAAETGLSAADLEYAKPETADFDIGSEADLDNTDFNLNEDSFDLSDTQSLVDGDDLSSTQVMDSVSDELGINLDDETEIRVEESTEPDSSELPDDISDLDLDFGSELADSSDTESAEDDDAINFDLPDDLDLSDTMDDVSKLDEAQEAATDTVPTPQQDDDIEFAQDEVTPDITDDDDDSLIAADEADIELDLGDFGEELEGLDLDEETGTEESIAEDLSEVSLAVDDNEEDFLDTMVESGGLESSERSDQGPSDESTIAMTSADMAEMSMQDDFDSKADSTEETFNIEDDISNLDVDFGGQDFADKDDDVSYDFTSSQDDAAIDLETEDDIELDVGESGTSEDTETLAEVSSDDQGIDDISIDLDGADEEGTMHVEAALDMDMGNLEEADLQTSEFKVSDDVAEIDATEQINMVPDLEAPDIEIPDLEPSADTGIDLAEPELDESLPDIEIDPEPETDIELEPETDIELEPETNIELEPDADIEPALDSDQANIDLVEEFDPNAGVEKTGTFAPGDFDEDLPELDEPDSADDIEGLMLPDDVDEVATKLDLAKAFIDMGDNEGARSSLEEVMAEGSEEQKAEATELLDQIK